MIITGRIHSVMTEHRWGLTAAILIVFIGVLLDPRSVIAAQDSGNAIGAMSEIGPKIAACWHPPHLNDEITLRLSFTRAGVLIGRPRISFMKSAGKSGTDTEVELANSILSAVYACTPLQFTETFGASVAGHILTIHFIAPHPKTQNVSFRFWMF